MKRKRRRTPINQKEEADKAIKKRKNDKEKKLIENANKYLTLPEKKTKTDNKPNILIKDIPKNPLFNFSVEKNEYKINCNELYDDINKIFYQVRGAKILVYKSKKILFVHIYNKLILFEINNNSYIFLTEILLKEKLGISSIEKFNFLKNNSDKKNNENIIYITFTCYNQIIISQLDMTNYNNFIVLKRLNICQRPGEKIYKMVGDNKMIFNSYTLVIFFPELKEELLPVNYSQDSYFKGIAVMNEGKGIIGLCTDMEIIIYDINKNKNLGKIIIKKEISSYGMGIKKYVNNKDDNLFILYSEKGVYLYDYIKKVMNKKLPLEGEIKTKIRKIKQFNNYIAILFNYYNLAIYNIEKDIITYKFKSNWTKSPGNEDFPILVKMSNDILLFGSDPFTVTILNLTKGDTYGNIRDKENKRKCELCKCIKVYEENLNKCNSKNEIYSFIKNSKTTFILKLSS